MKTKTFIITFLVSLLMSINSMGQSPASLIPEEDSISLAELTSKLVRRNHLCNDGQYSVIYEYLMNYTGNNVIEDINKNSLIKNIRFTYDNTKGFIIKKKYLQVVAYIYDENQKPLAYHITYGSNLGGYNWRSYLSEVIPDSFIGEKMTYLASQHLLEKNAFIFELSVNNTTLSSYYIMWLNGEVKFYEGCKEISKGDYTRALSEPLFNRLSGQ